MAMNRRRNVVDGVIIILASVMVSCVCGLTTPKPYDPLPDHKHLFVFGDSLFDTGNIQYLPSNPSIPANSAPYGMTYFHEATGRVSDGRVVPDFVALYANLSYPVPFLKPGAIFTDGANFASAGAGALEIHPNVLNLRIQVANFKHLANSLEQVLGPEEAKYLLKKSVYLFSMGGNDYFKFNTNNKNPSISEQIQYTGDVMSNLTFAFEEIYAIGGRKFAIQDVGPLGCLPIIKQNNPEVPNTECVERFLRHARIHNKLLRNILAEYQHLLPGFKFAVFDYYNALKDRIDHAEKYGFTEGKRGCCGSGELNGGGCGDGPSGPRPYDLCDDPSEYVFFDGGHTSERTNRQLADLMWDGSKDVIAPYNLKQFFGLSPHSHNHINSI